jgi:hypothetical protein
MPQPGSPSSAGASEGAAPFASRSPVSHKNLDIDLDLWLR